MPARVRKRMEEPLLRQLDAPPPPLCCRRRRAVADALPRAIADVEGRSMLGTPYAAVVDAVRRCSLRRRAPVRRLRRAPSRCCSGELLVDVYMWACVHSAWHGSVAHCISHACRSGTASAMAASADPTAQPYVVEDCRGVLQLLSDGTVVRSAALPFPVGKGADVEDGRVEWKDAVYDAGRCLGVRIYKPATNAGEEGKKFPVLIYFHGGGFCIGSFTWPNFHAGCLRLAAELPAIVLSFDYRLAPEHRLPAAHEDAAAALLWLRDQLASDPWLADAADPRKVFVSGESAGGNIAHHLALRFGTAGLEPVRITGYVLLMPAFISEQPTQSELGTPATAFLNRDACDRYMRLCLPSGANRDHPLVNPFSPDSPSLDTLDVGRMLVVAAEGDLLRDKNVEYAERLREARGEEKDDVELRVFAGEEHAFFGLKPASAAAGEVVQVIRRFVATGAAS